MAVKENTVRASGKKAKSQAPKGPGKSSHMQLRIKLVKSLIGRPKKQREVVKGLGLRRVNSEVLREECPEVLGMIQKIPHLLEVEVLDKK